MDPLTITTSVLRITGSCVSAAHTLWEVRNAWKRAPVTVSTLCSQLKLTAASLSRIQALLLGDTDVLRDKPDLEETFDTTLTSCLVLSKLLENLVRRIKKGALEGTKATWKTKFKTVWNENEIKELQQQLGTQQDAINVLVNLLQMDSISDIRRLIRRHEALLQEIARNTRALRKSHSVHAPASIFSADDASESIFSQLIGSKDCGSNEFETVILSTKVYSNAFSGALDPVMDDEQSGNARTITDTEFANFSTGPKPRNVAIATRNNFEASNLAINAPKIQSSIRSLKVTSIEAFTICDHTARSDVEFSFERGVWIEHVQQLTKERYYGQLQESQLQGQFNRKQTFVAFMFSSKLRVRVTVSCRSYDDRFLWYEEGEILEVDGIGTCADWNMQSQRRDESGNKLRGNVWVCDLEIEDAVERELNQLLDYFSCPMPALEPLSKSQQQTKISRIVSDDVYGQQSNVLVAHCRSFKDLQFLSSEIKKRWMDRAEQKNSS